MIYMCIQKLLILYSQIDLEKRYIRNLYSLNVLFTWLRNSHLEEAIVSPYSVYTYIVIHLIFLVRKYIKPIAYSHIYLIVIIWPIFII